MIKFDPSQITIEIVRLKSLTLALGGSITIIDEDKSTDTHEVTRRIECPLNVTRAFIQKHKKVTKYMIPVLTAIVRYEGKICTLERHPLGTFGELFSEGLDGTIHKWEPDSMLNLERFVYPLINKPDREWFFDGRYVYSFNHLDIQQVIDTAAMLTEQGNFRKLTVMSIDTQKLMYADELQPVERMCVAYVTSTGDFSISPPIWKNLDSVGGTKINEDEYTAIGYNFDCIDEYMSVNLNFALAAGKHIGELFGYDKIEPLQLPRLMLELRTVNLPNVPKQIKNTYGIGISFTHTFAWLLGLLKQANTLDTFIVMRSIMKYLTQKGIYRTNSFQHTNIFLQDKTIDDVKMQSLDSLLQSNDFTKMKLLNIIQQARSAGKRSATNQHQVSGLVTGD